MFRLLKIFLTAIFSLGFFSVNNSYSQDITGWGLNVGATYNSFRGNDYTDFLTFEIGYLAGIGYRTNMASNLNLNINLNYELKAYKLDMAVPFGEREILFEYFNRYHYVNFPVVFEVPFDRERVWSFELGTYVNYLFAESLEVDNIIPGFRKLDYGILSGFGRAIEINNNMAFHFQIRYEMGLVNTGENEDGFPSGIDVRTSSVKLMLTWVFAR